MQLKSYSRKRKASLLEKKAAAEAAKAAAEAEAAYKAKQASQQQSLQASANTTLLHKYKQLQVLHQLHHQMMNQATHLQQLL